MGFLKPVLLCNFNRPEFTAALVNSLRAVKPQSLFISIDGPRAHVEADKVNCSAVLDALQKGINWPCKIEWLVNESNKGCGRCVSDAISWFFDHVDEGIILEDDCIPTVGFFIFAEKMLDLYRDDTRIAIINGISFLPTCISLESNFWFSKYTSIWGWATWKRSWDHYDFTINSLNRSQWEEVITEKNQNLPELTYWMHVLNDQLTGKINSWDYQLQFTVWKNNQINISPLRNLVTNIGFEGSGTHTNHARESIKSYEKSDDSYNRIEPESNTLLDNITFYLQHLDSNNNIYGIGNPIKKIFDIQDEELKFESKHHNIVETLEKQREYILELESVCKERSDLIHQLDEYRKLREFKLTLYEKENLFQTVKRKITNSQTSIF